MDAPFARGNAASNTAYFMFQNLKSVRSGLGSGAEVDANTGKSPITRWIACALSWDDAVSNADDNTLLEFHIRVPEGSIILDCMLRLDEEFDGTDTNDVDIGDSDDADGYADGLDLTTSAATVAILMRDASAAYIERTTDAVKGTSGPQYYPAGGRIIVGIATNTTAMTQGEAVLFLRTISYCEPALAEQTIAE